jgi:hypothetical protein
MVCLHAETLLISIAEVQITTYKCRVPDLLIGSKAILLCLHAPTKLIKGFLVATCSNTSSLRPFLCALGSSMGRWWIVCKLPVLVVRLWPR